MCRKCERGKGRREEHPPALRATPLKGGTKRGTDRTGKERAKNHGQDGHATSSKASKRPVGIGQHGLVLTERPEPRPLVEAGKVNARGELGLTVELLREQERGQMDWIYSIIRKQCKPGEHQVYRLVAPKGELVETVMPGEIW